MISTSNAYAVPEFLRASEAGGKVSELLRVAVKGHILADVIDFRSCLGAQSFLGRLCPTGSGNLVFLHPNSIFESDLEFTEQTALNFLR